MDLVYTALGAVQQLKQYNSIKCFKTQFALLPLTSNQMEINVPLFQMDCLKFLFYAVWSL